MKANDVKAEKQTLEVELKTLTEKLEREVNKRQSAQKGEKEYELQLSDLKSQLKVRDMKVNQLEDENKTMKSELENVKTTLNQSMDDWKVEKSSILGMLESLLPYQGLYLTKSSGETLHFRIFPILYVETPKMLFLLFISC